ncbi:MAG: DUF1444 family protein [Planctomycetes bacterium]|nr:DUF1444 family protein [Planctomycetota bacterium]
MPAACLPRGVLLRRRKAFADTACMWIWIAVPWCVLAVMVAVLHHRFRRSGRRAQARAFLTALERELQRHPGVRFVGALPNNLSCLLLVDGQETPVALQELCYRAQAFPSSFSKLVDRLVEEIREVGLDRIGDHEWGSVAAAILPQIKTIAWVELQGRFGDAALVHRALVGDLAIVYVIDDPHAMVFVCRAHVRKWRRSEEDVHQLAMCNLRRHAGAVSIAAAQGAPVLLQTGDGYDAARVLTLDREDGLLVAMPDRDVLWLARESLIDLGEVARAAKAMTRVAPHPISAQIYRIRGGRLEALSN